MTDRINVNVHKWVFVMLLLTLEQPAYAQQWGQPPKKVEVDKYTPMTKEVPLPDVPPYSGVQKFSSGATVTATGSGGVSYVETFFIKESIDQASKWYPGALTGYGWKVTLATRQEVFANKDGASLTININGTHEPGWRSVIRFNYTPRGAKDGK